jgi:hypothetical protein
MAQPRPCVFRPMVGSDDCRAEQVAAYINVRHCRYGGRSTAAAVQQLWRRLAGRTAHRWPHNFRFSAPSEGTAMTAMSAIWLACLKHHQHKET